MAERKLSQLTEITEVEDNDMYVVMDSSDNFNTKKVKAVNTEEPIGVFGYIATPAATEIAVTDTYYTMQGVFNNPLLENFTVSGTGIKYTGDNPVVMQVHWSASMYSDTNNPTVSIVLSKNGVTESCSEQTTILKLSGQYSALSGLCVSTLETNDEILFKVKADTACDVTVQSLQASISKFY